MDRFTGVVVVIIFATKFYSITFIHYPACLYDKARNVLILTTK